MDEEAKPYSLAEASSLTGLSVDALRKRIVRKKLRASRSNEDGQWRVWLTSKDVETAKSGRSADRSGHGADGPLDESWTIKALEDAVKALREALERASAEVPGLRERLERAEREREEARVRAAAAEGEVKGLRDALRPFWRRWLRG
jgi:chromosome segregation ATPase